MADIPGIIEGAADGQGLGLTFLRHVERTRVLLHMLTCDPDPEREPEKDFDVLLRELEKFDAELAKRPMIIGLSKLDLPEVREKEAALRSALEARGLEVVSFCAATGEGIDAALVRLEALLREHIVRHEKKFLGERERPLLHGDGKGQQE